MGDNTIMLLRPMKKGDPTEYVYQWGGAAAKLIKDLGYNLIDIQKDDVSYENVSSALREYRPRVLISFSHGCPTSLVGQKECVITRKFSLDELLGMENFAEIVQPLNYATGCKYTCGMNGLDRIGEMPDICSPICGYNTNVGLLRNTIVIAIACYSASQLGRCAIKAGCSCYIGYKDLMLFPVDSIKSENIFRDVHLVFIRDLLEGKSVGEAEISMNLYEDNMIRMYKRTKYISLPLLWNKKNRKVLGDTNVTIM